MLSKITEKRVCALSLTADCFLAAVKLIFGKMANSSALFSDGVHSCADSVTSLVTMLGVLPDKNGTKKERVEKFTVRFICAALFVTGFTILVGALREIFTGTADTVPSAFASCVSLLALFVKELLFFFSRYASRKTGSVILMAQAWHHQSDALSCIGSFIGILGASLGMPMLDKAASIVISVMIIKTAVDILRGK
ncbi:MAG: cation diffusion facilitator family transporter [Acutalibacteraceae bacterium]